MASITAPQINAPHPSIPAESILPHPRRDGLRHLAATVLFLSTLLLYAPALQNGFVEYDDDEYVTRNAHVQEGLTAQNLRWALTTGEAANWHPLTWVSHMLDVELYGLEPKGHHFTSIALHALNAALLFLVLQSVTGFFWRALVVAALFAWHPLRVESVAWVAERKDVLSGLFFLLTVWAYALYARRGAWGWYAITAFMLALGLMSKPMLVTTPFLLLLLDVWPLRRTPLQLTQPAATAPAFRNGTWTRLILEKLPLLALALASSVATFLVQRQGGAVRDAADQFSIPNRIGNAFVSYARYIGKTLWPTDLAVFYPHPGAWPAAAVAGAVALVLGGCVIALLMWRRRPYVAVGWLWFLGTLVPVIGLVQVGLASMADRYTYLPGIGLLILIVWAGADALRRLPNSARLAGFAGTAACLALGLLTLRQIPHWQDTATLFAHALEVTDDNGVAHRYVGTELSKAGLFPEADEHFRAALEIDPNDAFAHLNRGNLLSRAGHPAGAIAHYRAAIEYGITGPAPHNALGTALAATGELPAAEAAFRKAAEQDRSANSLVNVANALRAQGKLAEATAVVKEAIQRDASNERAKRVLAELSATRPATASTEE